MDVKKGFIIDFDDTLVMTSNFILSHVGRVCKRLGIDSPGEVAVRSVLKSNLPFPEIFNNLFGDLGPKVLDNYREDAMQNNYAPTKGAISFMKHFSNGNEVVIVSNRTRVLEVRLLQAGLETSWCKAVLEATQPKPSKEAYSAALTFLNEADIPIGEIYIIGDNIDDYLACTEEYAPNFCAVLTGSNEHEDFTKAGLSESNIFKDLTEVAQRFDVSL